MGCLVNGRCCLQVEWADLHEAEEPMPRWWSWLASGFTIAHSKAQTKLDESRQLRDRLAKAEAAEVSIRKAILGIEKLALDPRFTTYSQKRIRIKLLKLLVEVDE